MINWTKAQGSKIKITFDRALVNREVQKMISVHARPVTVTESSFGPGRSAANLIDGSEITTWETQWRMTSNAYVVYTFSAPIVITSFSWYISDLNYIPTGCTILGSNDGESFTEIKTWSGNAIVGWENISLDNTTAYIYYKWTFVCKSSYYLKLNELRCFSSEEVLSIGDETAFLIKTNEYDYVPEGPLYIVSRTPTCVIYGDTHAEIVLAMDEYERFENAHGDITIEYNGGGGLIGAGGAVLPFSVVFTPDGLIPKPDQNAIGRLAISSIQPTATVIDVTYINSSVGDNKIHLSGINATGTLTNISDI